MNKFTKKDLVEMVRRIIKEENEFNKLNLDKNNLVGLYNESRQIIQNMQILQQYCKNNNVTDQGLEAIINILERSVKKFKTILNNK